MIYTNLDKLIDRVFDNSLVWDSITPNSNLVSNVRRYFFEDGTSTQYTTDENRLRIALPGFSKSDLNIEAEASSLLISADVEKEDSFKKSFSIKFKIPVGVNNESITATMENGILEVNFGQKVENKKIKIS